MSDLVAKFGSYVDSKIEKEPEKARKLLIAAYRAKLVQLRAFPDKRLGRSRDLMAVESMKSVLAPYVQPEKSALVSIFTPCELLGSAGIHPMFAEAVASYINGAAAERGFAEYAEAAGVPDTYCSYHKVLLGAILSDVLPKPAMIMNTSLVCDANNLTFRAAAEHYRIPWKYIDVPYDSSEESVQYVAQQLREAAKMIEEVTGRTIDRDDLKRRIACGKKTMETLAGCQKLKAGRYLSNDLTDELYEVFGTHVQMGNRPVLRYAEMLGEELKRAESFDGIRLLWMHTIPYYQKDLRDLLNFSGRCQVVSCDMNFDGFVDMDPEKPYESMARRVVCNSFNGPSRRRMEKSLEMCREQQIDGVIYFCHWGCKQTMAAAGNARRFFGEAGVPVLVLDGDGCDRRNAGDGQLMTRVEAFVEMLEDRKKNGKA
ncbi:MAG: 2-hydroxyacyl-CoA dehydratase family protein [Lachnospiraceae bacterium]|jgi:benzoyl-CoA reductase/2-hydroxyglutaryl-CoA dehydratase subunit BcrC/BadD/HgdB|nr:2-hydroxyacyl-CoA dehydratase family protein [Lachnospiraceae bacterium]MCI1328465.1 2-hydroxyacyl-CoA dehydratase family protein [Lachnospiraceae bacterium]